MTLLRRFRYFFHRFSDVIVCNSYSQREQIANLASHLTGRTRVIANGVDLARFTPVDRSNNVRPKQLRILVLARVVQTEEPAESVDGFGSNRSRVRRS